MRRALHILGWLMGSLLLLEVAVRVVVIGVAQLRMLEEVSTTDLARELDWYAKRRLGRGVLEFPYDPGLGWAPEPGTLGVNEAGGRDGRPVDPTRPRIVLLGDSFAWGYDVEVDESIGVQLERRLTGWQVVNLGVPGYGHDQMRLRYARDGRPLAPEVVVLLYVSFDGIRNSWHFFPTAKPWYTMDEGALTLHGVPVPSPSEVERAVFFRSRVVDLLRLYVEALRPIDPPPHQPLTHAILDAIVADVRAHGAVPLVVEVPAPDDLAHEAARPNGYISVRDKPQFDAWCADRSDVCDSVFDVVAEGVGDDLATFTMGWHWSPEGTERVADALVDVLQTRGLVPVTGAP